MKRKFQFNVEGYVGDMINLWKMLENIKYCKITDIKILESSKILRIINIIKENNYES